MSKRGATLELAVLGLLHDAPMHGYELRKHLNALLGWGRVLSYGTLYPCLKSLGHDGYIEALEEADVTARGRRAKVVYRLTAEGKEHFVHSLGTAGSSAWDDENFGVRFAFFARTDSPTRMRILEGRRNRLEERLEAVKSAKQRSRDRTDAYTLELQRHGLEAVERDVRWLTELIDRERVGGLPADVDDVVEDAASTAEQKNANKSSK